MGVSEDESLRFPHADEQPGPGTRDSRTLGEQTIHKLQHVGCKAPLCHSAIVVTNRGDDEADRGPWILSEVAYGLLQARSEGSF